MAKKTITTKQDAVDAVTALRAENGAAAAVLQGVCNDAARWRKIITQAANQGIAGDHFAALCGKMVRTRREWTHLVTDDQRSLAAFIGLLCAIGSPTEAESERLTQLLP